MVKKNPALAAGILWGDGTLKADGIVSGGAYLWSGRLGHRSVRRATANHWYERLVDPASLHVSDDDVLFQGADSAPRSVKIGPPGAWFYPPK